MSLLVSDSRVPFILLPFTDINDNFPDRVYPGDVDMRLLMSILCVLGWFLHGLTGCSL